MLPEFDLSWYPRILQVPLRALYVHLNAEDPLCGSLLAFSLESKLLVASVCRDLEFSLILNDLALVEVKVQLSR